MMRRLALAGCVVLLFAGGGSAARAATETVALVGADAAPLASGDSATPFTLALPHDAHCSGDSAHGGFRVQSYMLPVGVDPASVNFGSTGPLPSATGAAFRQPLYTTTTSPYVNAQTANAERASEPGAIVNVPTFNLAVFAAGEVPGGAYNVGVACTKGPASATVVERVWNARINVTSATGGLTWTTAAHTPLPLPRAAASHADATARAPASHSELGASHAGKRQLARPVRDDGVALRPSGAPPTMQLPVFDLLGAVPLARPLAAAAVLCVAALPARRIRRRELAL